MKCPSCPNAELKMTDRQGVEIDYCPNCRGVWLDRGELDKLIERSTVAAPRGGFGGDDDDDDDRGRHRQPPAIPGQQGGYDSRYPQKKKKSFWGEMFDFD